MMLKCALLVAQLATAQYCSGQYGSQTIGSEPGYLPDYQGDQYTSQQRIAETQALNRLFFDTIGGAPPAPALTPAQAGYGTTNAVFPSYFHTNSQLYLYPSTYPNNQGITNQGSAYGSGLQYQYTQQ